MPDKKEKIRAIYCTNSQIKLLIKGLESLKKQEVLPVIETEKLLEDLKETLSTK